MKTPHAHTCRPARSILTFATMLIVAFAATGAHAQVIDSDTDILNDITTFSTTKLQVRRYASLPLFGENRRINNLALQPGDNAFYASSMLTGRIYRVTDDGAGNGIATQWFDVEDSGFGLNQNGVHGGLRSLAFHPDFNDASKDGYGKFYGSYSSDGTPVNGKAALIGSTTNGAQSVVAEWTYNHTSGAVDANTHRELFRVANEPLFDHPIKSLSFNTAATETDGDYGLLYLGYGDAASSQEFGGNAFGSGQDLTNAIGKVLRIDPIGTGTGDYTTPGNTYAEDGDANTLAEVYSAGHRNPHHLNFARTEAGDTVLIVAEIGQDLVEEVNLIPINTNTNGETNGFDYGWGVREGTFVRRLGDGGYGVQQTNLGNTDPGGPQGSAQLLPADDALNAFIYPALMIDHNDPGDVRDSDAIAGGPVINGRYYFGNFSGNTASPGGQLYSVGFDELLAQKTSLDAGETPNDLTWIDDLTQHVLQFDHDNNPGTADAEYDTFAQLLTAESGSTTFNRTDFRFGVSPEGFLLISSKQTGAIYIVDNVQENVVSPTTMDTDVISWNFEVNNLGDTTQTNFFTVVSGDAFDQISDGTASQPIPYDLLDGSTADVDASNPNGGDYLVRSDFAVNFPTGDTVTKHEDGPQGVMESAAFTLPSGIDLLALTLSADMAGDGGMLDLVEVGGGVLATLDPALTDVALQSLGVDILAHAGKNVFLRITDNSSGGWGHVAVDNILIRKTVSVQAVPTPAALPAGLALFALAATRRL